MKHSPLFLVAAMLTGGLLAQGETSLDVQLTVNDLDDPEAVAHEFSITFGASLSIDTASLGDNDILIGRGSLFDTQLGEEAFSPELARVDTQNGASTATYRMDRPAEGWASWGIARLSISLASSGVSDQSGKFLPAQNLGFLNLDLAAVPQMAVQVPRYPIIEGEADPSVTFEVLYQTNYAIEITALGKGEISMTRLDASPQFITVNDSLVQVPSYDGTRLDASVESTQESADSRQLTVIYKVDRPEDGWGFGNSMALSLDRNRLGENNRAQPLVGTSGIGRALIARERTLTSHLSRSNKVTFEDRILTFEVTYQSTAQAIDLTTLGNNDVGSYGKNYHTGSRQAARFVKLLSEADEGRHVVAQYHLERPVEGWLYIGGTTRILLTSFPDGVATIDGTTLLDEEIGRVYFEEPEEPSQPYLVAVDDWLDDLKDVFGDEPTISMESDRDHDGLEDIIEFMVGTGPGDTSEATAMQPTLIEDDNATFLQLKFRERLNAAWFRVDVEGSVDGNRWISVRELFQDLTPADAIENGIRSITLRSLAPVMTFPYRFFRLRITSEI